MVAVPAPLRSNVLFNMLYRDVAAKVGVISLSSITLTELVLSRPISRSFKWNRIGIPGEITPETPAIPAPLSSVTEPTSLPIEPNLKAAS